ncbi:MAG TPA: hypothetical protein VFZ32_09865 [Micromonosporaceae bacterium]
MQAEIVVGILSVIATIAAGLLQRTWRARRPRLPKFEAISLGPVHESTSFTVLDSVKVVDLREIGNRRKTEPGVAVLTDSYLVRRESDAGNGMVFRYAASGGLEGDCVSHADNSVISSYESTHFRTSRAVSVLLNELAEGSAARITNRLVYSGSFDRFEGEDFETHIERPTRSLTIIVTFSTDCPCRAVTAQIQVGERGQTETVQKDRPVLMNGGTLLYWRVFPKDGGWLPVGAKYRVQWTWDRQMPVPAPSAQGTG